MAVLYDKLLPVDCARCATSCFSFQVLNGKVLWVDLFSFVPIKEKQTNNIDNGRHSRTDWSLWGSMLYMYLANPYGRDRLACKRYDNVGFKDGNHGNWWNAWKFRCRNSPYDIVQTFNTSHPVSGHNMEKSGSHKIAWSGTKRKKEFLLSRIQFFFFSEKKRVGGSVKQVIELVTPYRNLKHMHSIMTIPITNVSIWLNF